MFFVEADRPLLAASRAMPQTTRPLLARCPRAGDRAQGFRVMCAGPVRNGKPQRQRPRPGLSGTAGKAPLTEVCASPEAGLTCPGEDAGACACGSKTPRSLRPPVARARPRSIDVRHPSRSPRRDLPAGRTRSRFRARMRQFRHDSVPGRQRGGGWEEKDAWREGMVATRVADVASRGERQHADFAQRARWVVTLLECDAGRERTPCWWSLRQLQKRVERPALQRQKPCSCRRTATPAWMATSPSRLLSRSLF
jgi:hypothetical protein